MSLALAAVLIVPAGLARGQTYSSGATQTMARPVTSTAVTACPWLTEGSAVRVLGGNVKVFSQTTSSAAGLCIFTKLDSVGDELKIIVGSSAPACPVRSAQVVGVGTQASHCDRNASSQEIEGMVSGAVREKRFAVVLSKRTASTKPEKLQNSSILDQVAEQVAGNLF